MACSDQNFVPLPTITEHVFSCSQIEEVNKLMKVELKNLMFYFYMCKQRLRFLVITFWLVKAVDTHTRPLFWLHMELILKAD